MFLARFLIIFSILTAFLLEPASAQQERYPQPKQDQTPAQIPAPDTKTIVAKKPRDLAPEAGLGTSFVRVDSELDPQRAIELMENHVSDPLDLAGLARLVSLGKRQLNRLFMQKLGRSTMAFYRDLRLDKARGLLAHSTLSITQIALATGFANSAHFSKAFAVRLRAAARSARRRPSRNARSSRSPLRGRFG